MASGFLFFTPKGQKPKLSFHSSQKVLLARVTFLHVLKNGQKHIFLGFFTTFLSKTRVNSLFPDSDFTGKNLSKSVIIGQVPKKKFENFGVLYSVLLGEQSSWVAKLFACSIRRFFVHSVRFIYLLTNLKR